MRDFGLADKKAATEQLAARCACIDIDRIGIYGHSGGGFMSAAALLVKPYNEFFKVAVSSAGNHDNNVYNNSWAERYHGMKEVPAAKEEAKKDDAKKEQLKNAAQKLGAELLYHPIDLGRLVKEYMDKNKDVKNPTRFEIKVPTNPELATNLKGKRLAVRGDMDN